MLYGDGINDDTAAIQALLDTRDRLIELPVPEKFYLISKPLVIYSNQELQMPRLAIIKLADNCNCLMLKNARYEEGDANIYISGGIWDCNNRGQLPNPFHYKQSIVPGYSGYGMMFQNVKNLHLTHMIMKDPVTFAITLDTVSYFTVEDITFDFNYGNPLAINMDGVHLNGNCHYGNIHNLKGACYDDLVALNADEGTGGPISNIDIDGIYSENCHSAVRLLSVNHAAENIHIHNIHGTFYQYCIGITKFYPQDRTSYYDGLVFDNIYASKAVRLPIYLLNGNIDSYIYPLLWIEDDLQIKNISISRVYRIEKTESVPTLFIGKHTIVERLFLKDIYCDNQTGMPMYLIDNNGEIGSLFFSNLRLDGGSIFAAGFGKCCEIYELPCRK